MKNKHYCGDCCWCYCDSDGGKECIQGYDCSSLETDCKYFCDESDLHKLEEIGKRLQKKMEAENE